MTKRTLLLIMVLAAAAPMWGQMTFKPGGKLKPGDADADAKEKEPDLKGGGVEYKHALKEYQAGRTKDTIGLCNDLIKRYEAGPWVERAMLLKARAYFNRGDLKRADRTIGVFRQRFPGTTLNREVSDLQLAVGMAYLARDKYAGVRILQDMVEQNPYGQRADEAQFRVAEYYLRNKDYREAADAYTLVAAQYKDSRYREEALFMRAKASYLDNPGPKRDPLPYEEARAGLADYLRAYPDGRYAERAKKLLTEINDVLAQRKYLVAEYYRKQRRARAAQRYYRHVVTNYPDTKWAGLARKRMPARPKPAPAPEKKPAPRPEKTPGKNDDKPSTPTPEKNGETK